jgi:hypothetical protein
LPQLLAPGWLVREQKTSIPQSGNEILQPSRTAPHQASQHHRFLSQYLAQWKPAITRLLAATNPRRQTAVAERTLLDKIARRNQLGVTGTDAATLR